MSSAIETSIDQSGRIVVPKMLRDRLGLANGGRVVLAGHDGVIEIRVAATRVSLTKTNDGLVATVATPNEPLTDEIIRDTIESLRR